MPESKKEKSTLKVKGNCFYILLDKRQDENPISLFTDLQSSVEELKSLLSEKKGLAADTATSGEKKLTADTMDILKVEYVKERLNFSPVPWKDIAMELLVVP